MEKQVRVGYEEYQRLLTELEGCKKYIKELESKENVIIIDKSYERLTYYHGISFPRVIKEVPEVTDRFKEISEELTKSISNAQRYINEYRDLKEKMKSNWVYSLFYSKK